MNQSFLEELKTWIKMKPSLRDNWRSFENLSPHDNFRRLGWNTFLYETLSGFVTGRDILILGGYKGESASEWCKHGPLATHIFEPIDNFSNLLKSRFERDDVHVYNVAAGARNGEVTLNLENDATGTRALGTSVICEQISLNDWLQTKNLKMGLTEINIEGGEYDLFESLSKDSIERLGAIAIQFHFSDEQTAKRRSAIQSRLRESHVNIIDLDLVWSIWIPRAQGN